MSRQRRRLATAATGWAFSSPYVALLLFFCLMIALGAVAQENVHPQSGAYEWPADPLVKNKIPLSNFEKGQLVAFLITLTDSSFLKNKELGPPD